MYLGPCLLLCGVCNFITFVGCYFVKVSRQVKLELEDSEYFHVVGPEDAGCKVAPGLSATFTVIFTPQENKVLETGQFDCSIE